MMSKRPWLEHAGILVSGHPLFSNHYTSSAVTDVAVNAMNRHSYILTFLRGRNCESLDCLILCLCECLPSIYLRTKLKGVKREELAMQVKSSMSNEFKRMYTRPVSCVEVIHQQSGFGGFSIEVPWVHQLNRSAFIFHLKSNYLYQSPAQLLTAS
jgi:hypothetical protein